MGHTSIPFNSCDGYPTLCGHILSQVSVLLSYDWSQLLAKILKNLLIQSEVAHPTRNKGSPGHVSVGVPFCQKPHLLSCIIMGVITIIDGPVRSSEMIHRWNVPQTLLHLWKITQEMSRTGGDSQRSTGRSSVWWFWCYACMVMWN